MPKFLDAPSWYDSTGTLKTITNTVKIYEGGGSLGNIELPVTQVSNFPHGSTTWTVPDSDSSFAVLYNHPSSWGPCWSSAPTTANSLLWYTGGGLSWKQISDAYRHHLTISVNSSCEIWVDVLLETSNVYSSFSYALAQQIVTSYGMVEGSLSSSNFPAYGTLQYMGKAYSIAWARIAMSGSYSYNFYGEFMDGNTKREIQLFNNNTSITFYDHVV